jgi:hypothetical protein
MSATGADYWILFGDARFLFYSIIAEVASIFVPV